MLWAVIMAGGVGSRFWPESRRNNPKQFLPLLGRRSLLEDTVKRLSGVVPPSRILIFCQEDKVARIRRMLPSIPAAQIIGEPAGRNTAPCAAVAAAMVARRDAKGVLALLPADHRIGREGVFRRELREAAKKAAETGWPVTFGIRPAYPHTGYGYLELNRKRASSRERFYPLKRFHEKPDARTAVRYYRSGNFLWNSGMFVWKAAALLDVCLRELPAVHRLAQAIAQSARPEMRPRFLKMPSVSLDYGLMEKLKNRIWTLPAGFDWSDVGGWQALAKLGKRDRQGNIVEGKAVLVDAGGNLVRNRHRLVALIGVRDLAVIDTPDALLICPLEKAEAVRSITSELERKEWNHYL